ncbi:MAG: hypothetical protein N2558_04710, partial [Patescibacteria group bacterium]|nr:hypothetical protein [Patescibacteria group bacterium]
MIVQREHFFKVIEELESYPFPISFDSETSGLEFCDTMFSLSVATSNSSYYFNFNPNKDCFGNLPCDSKILPEEYKQYIPNIFRNKPYCFAHNAKFDLLQLRKENIILPQDARIYDTLILAVLYNNTYQNYSLDYLSKKFLAKEKDDIKSFMVKNKLFTKTTKKSSKKEEKKYLFDKVPLNIIAEYAEKDAKLTLELGEFLLSLINERDESSSFPNKVIYVANSESDLLNVLVDIEYRGIRLDIDHINKSIEICTKKIEELDNRFLEISGKKFDNKRDTIVDALTGDGVSLSINEDTGIFKTNKSNLVKSDSEIASLIVERRCIDTELKYLHSYMDYCIGDVVHPIYNTGKGS